MILIFSFSYIPKNVTIFASQLCRVKTNSALSYRHHKRVNKGCCNPHLDMLSHQRSSNQGGSISGLNMPCTAKQKKIQQIDILPLSYIASRAFDCYAFCMDRSITTFNERICEIEFYIPTFNHLLYIRHTKTVKLPRPNNSTTVAV